MSAGEDHHPGGRGGSRAGGRRGLDPASRHRQDRPQEPGSDAHQRPSKIQLRSEQFTVLIHHMSAEESEKGVLVEVFVFAP